MCWLVVWLAGIDKCEQFLLPVFSVSLLFYYYSQHSCCLYRRHQEEFHNTLSECAAPLWNSMLKPNFCSRTKTALPFPPPIFVLSHFWVSAFSSSSLASLVPRSLLSSFLSAGQSCWHLLALYSAVTVGHSHSPGPLLFLLPPNILLSPSVRSIRYNIRERVQENFKEYKVIKQPI